MSTVKLKNMNIYVNTEKNRARKFISLKYIPDFKLIST